MIPTREQAITLVQQLLGDPTGANFTATIAGPFVDQAYREWVTQCDINQIPDAKFTAYYWLPAFQAQFLPAQASLNNFGEIITLEEQDIASTATIQSCSATTPIQVTTTAPHGFAQNQEIEIYGVTGQTAANGRWLANIISPTIIGLPGSVSIAAYVSGGTCIAPSSNDSWTVVNQISELPDRVPLQRLGVYAWENETFYFVGSTMDRLLRIIFYGSGTAPASGSLGYDNILEVIAYRAGAIAGGSRDMARAQQLAADAALYLDLILTEHVRSLQRQPVRPRAYKAGGYSGALKTWPFLNATPGNG